MSTKEPSPAGGAREMRHSTEPMKHLAVDVPESLHRAIKAQCAMRGTKIADEVRELILQKYGQKGTT